MIKIRVSKKVREMQTKNGKLVVQECYAFLPQYDFPQVCEVLPPKGEAPYPPGDYQLDPESFEVGDFKSLTVRPKLIPLPASQQSGASKAA